MYSTDPLTEADAILAELRAYDICVEVGQAETLKIPLYAEALLVTLMKSLIFIDDEEFIVRVATLADNAADEIILILDTFNYIKLKGGDF
jgi:hypothetical protein